MQYGARLHCGHLCNTAPFASWPPVQYGHRQELFQHKDAFIQALAHAKSQAPALKIGMRVMHREHGAGYIADVNLRDHRGRPVHAAFENGETHHYSSAQADAKLVVVDAPRIAADSVSLDMFTQAVLATHEVR